MRTFLGSALAALVLAAPSAAQQTHSPTLDAFSTPLPPASSLLHVQVGWPGISGTYLYGLAPRATVGGRFTLNYGFEGATNLTRVGLKMQGVMRIGLMESDKLNASLEVAPGLLLYFPTG